MFRTITSAIVGATLVGLVPAAGGAQPGPSDPPFRYVVYTTRTVKPGMQPAVEEYYTKLRAAEAKLNVRGLTDVYAVTQGARTPAYVTTRSLRTLAELDDDAPTRSRETLVRAYGEKEAARLGSAMGLASESVSSVVLAVAAGLGNFRPGKDGGHFNYAEVRVNYVKPGMQPQYAALMAKQREVRAASGAASEYRWSTVEGPVSVHGITRFFDSWKERDAWENDLVKVLGQAEADKWFAQYRECFDRAETYVLRRRSDLSHAAQPASTTRQ